MFTNNNSNVVNTSNVKHINRTKEREIWRELQILLRGYRHLGFDYVIKRLPPARICFGSSMTRKTLPAESAWMSPLMRRIIPKPAFLDSANGRKGDNVSVESAIEYKKNDDKKGYGPMASKVPRFVKNSDSQHCIGLYDPSDNRKAVKSCWPPFGRTMKVPRSTFAVPGPGTYVSSHQRKYIFKHSLGRGPVRVVPAVRFVCSTQPFAHCDSCGKVPYGDYRQLWNTVHVPNAGRIRVLCRPCMAETERQTKFHSKTAVRKAQRMFELEQFQYTRHCAYYHDHQNTTASVKLLSNHELRTKFRRENYLSMFNM